MFRNGFLFFSALLLFCGEVSAQSGTGGPILFPSMSVRQETGVFSGDTTTYPMNLRGGYKTAAGWYFGLMYSSVAASGGAAANEQSWGNSVGYFYSYVSFIATYYFSSATLEWGPQGRVARSDGTGFQFDLSFLMPAFGSVSIGPVITFKSFSYKRQEDANGLSGESHSETFLFPAFGFMIQF
jgi:hypothetical protein